MSLSILSARTRRTCRADQAAACEWCHLSILMRPRRAFTFEISSVDVRVIFARAGHAILYQQEGGKPTPYVISRSP